jgi:hypothetical protein
LENAPAFDADLLTRPYTQPVTNRIHADAKKPDITADGN